MLSENASAQFRREILFKVPNLNFTSDINLLENFRNGNIQKYCYLNLYKGIYSIAVWSHLQTCLLWLPEGAHNVLLWVDINDAYSEGACTYKCHRFTLLFTNLISTGKRGLWNRKKNTEQKCKRSLLVSITTRGLFHLIKGKNSRTAHSVSSDFPYTALSEVRCLRKCEVRLITWDGWAMAVT